MQFAGQYSRRGLAGIAQGVLQQARASPGRPILAERPAGLRFAPAGLSGTVALACELGWLADSPCLVDDTCGHKPAVNPLRSCNIDHQYYCSVNLVFFFNTNQPSPTPVEHAPFTAPPTIPVDAFTLGASAVGTRVPVRRRREAGISVHRMSVPPLELNCNRCCGGGRPRAKLSAGSVRGSKGEERERQQEGERRTGIPVSLADGVLL